ncbi:TPA: hypothetical protein PTV74_003373 [Clostridium botulinum]|nr:hypothetical protein [Clostridium botulinum]HDK7206525.1 hypothetical protein [Clostridium botulinum]HDK7210260.1 hypothetical protein [Clostridium botulinum]HDK7265710.1 hypothetical protein [Clostridium botulinum]HDK7269557.1 hypothetical protein [Clostridium botulinum]
MDFDDLKDLYKYVEKAHEEAACNDVPKVTKEVESDVVDEDVYSRYNNDDRRGKHGGGLGDVKNMETHISKVGNVIEIEITNETPLDSPNDGISRNYRLDEAIEYGRDYYEYPKGNRDESTYTYLKPRPFTEKTELRLFATKEHEKAYKNAMKAKGIDID